MPGMTVGWQKMKKRAECDNKTHRKGEFMKVLNENGSIKAWRRKNYSWICSSRIRTSSRPDRNSKHPGSVSSLFVHSHSCLQSFKCMDHLVHIITHPDLLSLHFKLFHLHRVPDSKALSWGPVISFKGYINMIFTKPETESDEARVISYLIFRKLEGKQTRAHMRRICQLDEKLIDQCASQV